MFYSTWRCAGQRTGMWMVPAQRDITIEGTVRNGVCMRKPETTSDRLRAILVYLCKLSKHIARFARSWLGLAILSSFAILIVLGATIIIEIVNAGPPPPIIVVVLASFAVILIVGVVTAYFLNGNNGNGKGPHNR